RKTELLDGVGSFGHNLANLAGLQIQLAGIDVREFVATSTPAFVALSVATIVGTTSVAIVIGSVAWLMANAFGLPLPYSLLIVSGILMIGAGAVAAIALARMRECWRIFRRSQEELERNLAWIKTVLAQSGR